MHGADRRSPILCEREVDHGSVIGNARRRLPISHLCTGGAVGRSATRNSASSASRIQGDGTRNIERSRSRPPTSSASVVTGLRARVSPVGSSGGRNPPLVYCARVGTVRLLLRSGARLDSRDHGGRTALHHAACWRHPGSIDVVHMFLERGANPAALDDGGKPPLHCEGPEHRSGASARPRTRRPQCNGMAKASLRSVLVPGNHHHATRDVAAQGAAQPRTVGVLESLSRVLGGQVSAYGQ